ncbi:hypothetical protein GCM10020221_18010 [Streptomyces thioluteus]|uniref:Secreted protein n=1 Tax=Streptomyces thioluteus TaxID=66431 RepID=A0ABP6J803_STRTU
MAVASSARLLARGLLRLLLGGGPGHTGLGVRLLGQRSGLDLDVLPGGDVREERRLGGGRLDPVVRLALFVALATPTTAPTVVTAVAEATANPRTEIRLTRFPSSIARAR